MTKKFEINDILSAVDSIAKIDKEKGKIKEKKDRVHKNSILTLNNQAKPGKSKILVLNEMIE